MLLKWLRHRVLEASTSLSPRPPACQTDMTNCWTGRKPRLPLNNLSYRKPSFPTPCSSHLPWSSNQALGLPLVPFKDRFTLIYKDLWRRWDTRHTLLKTKIFLQGIMKKRKHTHKGRLFSFPSRGLGWAVTLMTQKSLLKIITLCFAIWEEKIQRKMGGGWGNIRVQQE